ncbi:MAG: YeeE/YedE thiosulfate transporter family protein [Bacteroidetes bacterium]|nr:YeeE/YedE thiosulfate transporter family protein [Bacteroidota bacterium]
MEKSEEKPGWRKGNFYVNPYLGGLMLGLVLLATFYITGRGLGASGAVKNTVVTTVHTLAPAHAESSHYYSKFLSTNTQPMNNWLVFEVLGVLAGAFLSGLIYNRLNFRIEHSPKITSRRRLIFAFAGGMLFGFGSQLARGCTSGAALSGMAVLSAAGFITMMAIFGTAYVFAYILRKNWI